MRPPLSNASLSESVGRFDDFAVVGLNSGVFGHPSVLNDARLIDDDDHTVRTNVAINATKTDKGSIVGIDGFSVQVGKEFEFKVVLASKLSVGPRGIYADAQHGSVGGIQGGHVVLESAHLLVAHAGKSTGVEDEDGLLSFVFRERDLSLVGGSEGKGWGGVSNVDHAESSGHPLLIFMCQQVAIFKNLPLRC